MALDQLHREVGTAVAEGAQLVNGHDAGMLQLAGDLGFLDEAANHVGLVAMRFEQNLHRQVATKVGIAALENGPHAAASDLAEELQPRRTLGRSRVSRAMTGGSPGQDR